MEGDALPKLMVDFRTGRREDSECSHKKGTYEERRTKAYLSCDYRAAITLYPTRIYSYYAFVKFSIQLSYHHSILLIL